MSWSFIWPMNPDRGDQPMSFSCRSLQTRAHPWTPVHHWYESQHVGALRMTIRSLSMTFQRIRAGSLPETGEGRPFLVCMILCCSFLWCLPSFLPVLSSHWCNVLYSKRELRNLILMILLIIWLMKTVFCSENSNNDLVLSASLTISQSAKYVTM